MGESTNAIDEVDEPIVSLEISSVGGEIDVKKDGDYVIDDEERLPFECKKVLGNGWSAVVEKVEHKKTKEAFAKKVIKFPRAKTKSREQAEERYYNKAAIIRTLNPHHHVVELFATYTTPRSGGLLLRPAADQGDLQQFLDNYADALDDSSTASAVVARMTKVLEQAFGCLASGLKYMHGMGIRHKDVKPGNILIHEGVVVYTDFGASKDTNKDGQCTTEGRPESMTRAPEVLEYDKRNLAADVFSLGCVFVEMLLRLSRLTEHEDLEAEGYSGIMEALHTLLRTAELPQNLSCILEIVILMTLRDPLRRPASEEIEANVCSQEGLSCLKCHILTAQIQPRQFQPLRPQPEWDPHFQRYLYLQFNDQYQQWYWNHHDGQSWVFFDWVPLNIALPAPQLQPQLQTPFVPQIEMQPRYDVHQTYTSPSHLIRQGKQVSGSYDGRNAQPDSHYEHLDSSFYVRDAAFFLEGRVFSVLFSEPADENAVGALENIRNVTDYNDSVSVVNYGELVHAQVRKFIVVRRRKAFCFAVPIFTYQGQGTKKQDVTPDEHAIAFSHGHAAQLLPEEAPLTKDPICIVMNKGEKPLAIASRIYFGIHHPIQYNVKVKDLGIVHQDWLPTFIGYWNIESISDTR